MCPGAPQMIPRHLVSKEASIALDLARSLARDPGDGLGKGVFFSDVTFWLDRQGKDWRDLGIDYEAVINELAGAPVPQLYMTLSQKAHAILCDARGEVEGAGVVGHRGTFRRAAFSSAALNGADIHVPKRCQTAAAGVSSLHATGNCVRFGSDYQGGRLFACGGTGAAPARKRPRCVLGGLCQGLRFAALQLCGQGGTRAGHPGADCADRAARRVGGLGVGEPEQLGEDERLSAVVRERGQEFLERHPFLEAGQPCRLGALDGRAPVVGVGEQGRAAALRKSSTTVRRAMVRSQVRAEERPSKRCRVRSARRNVSCARSSAACGSADRWATYRTTSRCRARTKASAASRSPARAASAQPVETVSSAVLSRGTEAHCDPRGAGSVVFIARCVLHGSFRHPGVRSRRGVRTALRRGGRDRVSGEWGTRALRGRVCRRTPAACGRGGGPVGDRSRARGVRPPECLPRPQNAASTPGGPRRSRARAHRRPSGSRSLRPRWGRRRRRGAGNGAVRRG